MSSTWPVPAARPVPTRAASPLEADLVGGGIFVLAEEQPERFTLAVCYRGLPCRICRGYLAQLDREVDELASLGVAVTAVSGDDAERARRSVSAWHLEHLGVSYAQSVISMRPWGPFVSQGVKDGEPDPFGEPGAFQVRADGTIHTLALNSMPAARPRIQNLVAAIRSFVDNDYPPRGES